METAIKQELPVAELTRFAGNDFAKLALFCLYLGLNNRQRASESKDLKNQLDQILNTHEYQQQAKNPSLEYLQGNLAVNEHTEQAIRALLDNYGYATAGRQLELKIAAGSDYTAWTAGDQTDCCMPFSSSKNREYLLRPDTAYFVCSIVDEHGNSEIIAQSVLVQAEDYDDPSTKVIAFDNIEIANRALKYRPVIAQGYAKIKQVLINQFARERQLANEQPPPPPVELPPPPAVLPYGYQEPRPPAPPPSRLKLLIGSAFNDDGGLITGGLPATKIDSMSPVAGKLSYSDCFDRDHAHLYYDSESVKSEFSHFGLQVDLFARSKIKELVTDQQVLQTIKGQLETIGAGVDDGDGGLSFADNYSVVLAKDEMAVGYVVGAEYLTPEGGEDEFVTFEQVGFAANSSLVQQHELLDLFLSSQDFVNKDGLQGALFKPEARVLGERMKQLYPQLRTKDGDDGSLMIAFN